MDSKEKNKSDQYEKNISNEDNQLTETINEFINSAFEKADEELKAEESESVIIKCTINNESSLREKNDESSEINKSLVQKVEFCLTPEVIENSSLETTKNEILKSDLLKKIFSKLVDFRGNLIKYLKQVIYKF